MKILLPALFLALASGAAAAPHSVVVRVSHGTRVYTHAMQAEEGNQENFVGKPDGGEDRNMVVNIVLVRAGAKYGLELQTEISRADKSESFQAQSSLEMRAGQRLTAVECGSWKVEVVLDGKPGRAAPAGAAWSSDGLEDYRLTADLLSSAGRRRCRLVMRGATQSNIAESATKDGRREGFILNASLADPRDGGYALHYQLQQTPLEMISETTLTLGNKRTVPAGDGNISFLLEGTPPVSAPAAAAPPSSDGGGAVPLLR